MQPIEKALFKVVDEGLGSNYTYPAGATLDNIFRTGTTLNNPYNGQVPTKVKFGFGTKKELDLWIKNTKEKYPVVWLVYPLTEQNTNNGQSLYCYPNARLIFAINNKSDKLVETRLQTTKFVLDQLTELFSQLMRTSGFKRFVWIDRTTKIEQIFRPNFSYNESQDKSAVIDVWDAITYDCDLCLNPICIPK